MNFDSVVKQIFGKLKLLGATDSTPIGNVGDALKVAAVTTAEQGYDDTGNSSTTPLGANATFTGVAIDIKDYSSITVAAFSDVSSATDGLKMQFSPDGTNWDHQHSYSVTGGIGVSYAQAAELRYFRIVYVNNATPQSFFRLTTILKPANVSPSRYTVGQNLTSGMMADVTKSVVWGLSSSGGGTYVAAKVTPSGSLTTAIGDITGVVGQNTMANSLPVTIASNQTAVPASQSGTWNITDISGTVSLPTGAATSAKQDSQITELQAIKGYVDGVETKLDTLITQTDGVEGSLSSIDTKVATSAKQDSQITELQAIKGYVDQIETKLDTLITQTDGVEGSLSSIDTKVATSAKQDTGNTSLASIDGKISTTTNGIKIDSIGNGFISSVNSTTSLLTANSTFTGTWEDASAYATGTIIGSTDVNGSLYVEFSTDGTNVDRSILLSDGTSSTIGIHTFIIVARYYRARYVNGTSNQGVFRLQTILNKHAKIAMPTSRINQALNDYTDVLNVRAALVARTPNGGYKNIETDSEGDLDVHITNPSTAFGEVSVAQDTPVAQLDFVYGLNTNIVITATTGSGTATSASSLLSLSTTAATNSSAQLTSRRAVKYRPGQGSKARFTALFTLGVAGSNQYAGMGNSVTSDGFFFGYQGATFGIFRIAGGSVSFTAQTSWNADTMDGSKSDSNPSGMLLDPTKGNVYQIKMQYLGFGGIYFYIENSQSGQFTLVHVIRYANLNTATSLLNPTLNLLWRTENTTNNTNIVVQAASGALFVEGQQRLLGPRYGSSNNKAVTTTTTSVLALRVATTFNGVTNRAQLRLRGVSAAVSGNGGGVAYLTVVRNPTLGGTPVYTPVSGTTADNGVTITNGQSVISVDTAGTTVTGGVTIFNGTMATANSFAEDVSELDLFVNPGDILVFALTTSANGTGGVSVNWSEDI